MVDSDVDLSLKYQHKVIGLDVQTMQYLLKTLPKEATGTLKNCGTDVHATLQLIHLELHPVKFLFQTDECCVIPVQETKGFTEYTNDVK